MVDVIKPVAGSKRPRNVTRGHRTLRSTVGDTATETVARLGANASECSEEGRVKMRQVERSFAQYVREQPLKSILIAAGVGLVLGRFWLRR